MVGFFLPARWLAKSQSAPAVGVVQNDIGLRGAGTLAAAGKAFYTAHHFTH
jgi:hypothetical protein